MTRVPAPPVGRPPRPLVVRAAHAWYAWAGLGLTAAAAYFAANGQLRVGEGAQLRAADPVWKPVSRETVATVPAGGDSKIVLTPAPAIDPDDPFRAAPPDRPAAANPELKPVEVKPQQVKPAETKPASGAALPDPFVAVEPKATLPPKAGAVLDAYVKDKAVVPVKSEDPAALELMRSIKRAFDPQGILGPGRLLGLAPEPEGETARAMRTGESR